MHFILESGSFHCYVPKYLPAENGISILADPSDLLNVVFINVENIVKPQMEALPRQ